MSGSPLRISLKNNGLRSSVRIGTVQLRRITEEGMVKTTTFYDPDGNALMLAQDLTQA